ncbi:MAG: twin-arginine translocation signal domain-containing protein [Dehalococcoidales bacterium]|nr:twin-arginine translocation signal domain-containing protein [Dehalococcoidales bacterium]
MQSLSRREFLKLGGVATAGVILINPLKSGEVFSPPSKTPLVKKIGETTSICAYCAVGCGIIIAADGENIINIEGDPDHPINTGKLCSKAQALHQIRTVNGKLNPSRMTKVLYRAPYTENWEEKSWAWALDEIAQRVKQTRDTNWIEKDKDGVLINRTEAIAHLGGAALDNEECYLLTKMNRALGMVYIEHQARI